MRCYHGASVTHCVLQILLIDMDYKSIFHTITTLDKHKKSDNVLSGRSHTITLLDKGEGGFPNDYSSVILTQ